MQHARAFAHPAWARELPALTYVEGTGDLPRTGSLLAIDNPNVILSACKPADDGAGTVIRLYNASEDSQDTTVQLGIPTDRWCRTDLREQWDETGAHPVEGTSCSHSPPSDASRSRETISIPSNCSFDTVRMGATQRRACERQ